MSLKFDMWESSNSSDITVMSLLTISVFSLQAPHSFPLPPLIFNFLSVKSGIK